MAREIITCTQCGIAMNCHAEKPTEPVTTEECRQAERGIGVLVEELHRCSRCGDTQSRRIAL